MLHWYLQATNAPSAEVQHNPVHPPHPQLLQEGREVEGQSTLGKSRKTPMNSRKPLTGEI